MSEGQTTPNGEAGVDALIRKLDARITSALCAAFNHGAEGDAKRQDAGDQEEKLRLEVRAALASRSSVGASETWDTERRVLMDAAWVEGSNVVRFDPLVVFGFGHDFEGLERRRQEILTRFGSFVVWPDRLGGARRWSFYGGPDGAMMFEKFDTVDEAKEAVMRELVALASAALSQEARP